MEWAPATKPEVLAAIDADWADVDPILKSRLSKHFVDPYPSAIFRFGRIEQAFVVAKIGEKVVFFDDIEDEFGTAEDSDGKLTNAASYGSVVLALRELERLATNEHQG